MKLTLYMAIMALLFSSCKKDSFTIPDVTPQASLQAKIHPMVNEPREVALGDVNAVFSVGERITVYVPYEAIYDQVITATLNVTDENGEVLATIDMTNSNHLVSGHENVPVQLQGSEYVFATIEVSELMAGKWLNIHSQVSGGSTVSDDHIYNAFTVQ